ncbi:MAG: sigma 54-interacting transcriptional regulator [Bacteroidota bacterium]
MINRLEQEIDQQNTLLQITEKVSQLRTYPAFLSFVITELKPIFDFHDSGLFLLTDDGKMHYDLTTVFTEICPSSGNHYQNQKYGSQYIVHENTVIEDVINKTKQAGGPVLFDFKDFKERFPNYPQFKDMDIEKSGRRDALAYHFEVSGEPFGVFFINKLQKNFFKAHQFPFFKKVTDQLAIALSNIKAITEIKAKEKEQAIQLQMVNGLGQEKTWQQKIATIPLALQEIVDCSLFCFQIAPKFESIHFHALERIGPKEYRDWDLSKLSDFIQYPHKGSIDLSEIATPLIIEELETDALKQRSLFLTQLANRFSMQSLLLLSFDLDSTHKVQLLFMSRRIKGYTRAELRRLQRQIPSLKLALDRQIAYEKIERLNERLTLEKRYLEEEFYHSANFGEIIGSCPLMQKVYNDIKHVAALDTTVLICGETGTGKELVARAIHMNSKRKNKILVKVNCAAIPKEMMESELFGHTKGAFTGATSDRIGKFELADEGTIFLDEIGELPLELQSKMLRVLQEKEVERLGGNKVRKVNFRVIAATNKNLELAVQEGSFRADLFYRLFIFPIVLPPLRDRGSDILEIADYIAQHTSQNAGLPFKGFSVAAQERMLSYNWPGNVRELENVIQQDLVRNRNSKLELLNISSLNYPLQNPSHSSRQEQLENVLSLPEDFTLNDIDRSKQELERQLILKVLEKTKWRVSGRHGASALLDVKAVTLEYRMKKLGIKRKPEESTL